MRIAKWFMISLVALASCATLYQKEGLFTNGYSDLRSGKDTFVVTFRANEFTSAEAVKEYALRRAAAVALKNGYRYFAVLDETGKGKHLHYPSIRMTIQCFHEKPNQPVIDARSM
ncbi:MAG: hypothetical protein KGR16_06855 [Verrucomicrobia bacterium]|nr:hypothetical protein [Verrucomicrobiota bacterium]MDE3048060.1 hypothetical protein [Verrucomicrobiota bacterium]